MKTAKEVLEYEEPKFINDNPPKTMWLSDVERMSNETLKVPEHYFNTKAGTAQRFAQGVVDTMRSVKEIPSSVRTLYGQSKMALGGYFGMPNLVKRGKINIQTAQRNLEAMAEENALFQASDEDKESFAYMLGSGVANYATMIIGNYGIGGLAKAAKFGEKATKIAGGIGGYGTMAAMEASGEVQEGIQTYKQKTGDTKLENITPAWATKEAATTMAYTVGSVILEDKFGFGKQKKIFKNIPATSYGVGKDMFKRAAKEFITTGTKTAISEGGTEMVQEGLNIAIDYADGTISLFNKDGTFDFFTLSERLKGMFIEGAIGAVIGGTAGISAAIYNRRTIKKELTNYVKDTVPEKDVDAVVDGIYESANNKLSNVIATELELSSELRNKHGEIFDSMQAAIAKEVEHSGAYANYSEDKKAQYIHETAKLYADQVLAEANNRGVLIDEVMRGKDIVWDNGIKFLNNKERINEQKQELKAQIEENAPAEEKEQNLNDVVSSYEGAQNFDVEAMPTEEKQAVFEAEQQVNDAFVPTQTEETAQETKPQEAEETVIDREDGELFGKNEDLGEGKVTIEKEKAELAEKIKQEWKESEDAEENYSWRKLSDIENEYAKLYGEEELARLNDEYEEEQYDLRKDKERTEKYNEWKQAQAELSPETVEAMQEDTLPTVEAEDTVAATQEKPKKKRKSKKSDNTDKIEDFGEYLYGAKKDLWTGFKNKLNEPLPEDAVNIKLSEVFPEPNYEKAIADGVDVNALATIKALRDLIPTKPKYAYKLKQWRELVFTLRNIASSIVNNNFDTSIIDNVLKQEKFADINNIVKTYMMLGYPYFIKAKGYAVEPALYHEWKPGQWVLTNIWHEGDREGFAVTFNKRYISVNGEYFVENINDAIDAVKEKIDTAANAEKKVKFDIWYNTSDPNTIYLGKKVRSGKYLEMHKFNSSKEAREYLKNNYDALVEELEKLKQNPMDRGEVNQARIGEDYRKGTDATPEIFADMFGFRGVQFGNWVEQQTRVKDLNEAYDALVDLAKVLNIPTRAISLNGTLGLAFGARGHKGAAAHYEPDKVVINLTKMNGAGSLAHEWFHALDNSFMKKDDKSLGYTSEMAFANNPLSHNRPEVMIAFYNLRNALEKSALMERAQKWDLWRSKDYWSTIREMGARTFEQYVKDKLAEKGVENDFLANIFAVNGDNNVYLNEEEKAPIYEAYDKLFDTLQTRETDKGVELYQTGENVQKDEIKLIEREGGPKIADDSEMVETVTIPENSVPDFKTKREIVAFIKNILGKERNITIKSTGENVLVSNGAINRVSSKSRSKEYNEAFSAVRKLIENAKYSGFEEADAAHPNVKGQDVYHSALIIGTKPYAVQFKVDIPLENGTHNYAGHKIKDIKIASSDSVVERFNSPIQNEEAIHNISLAVLREKVKPANYNILDKTLTQKSKQGVKGSFTPSKNLIQLFKDADASTLPHEFSHYWLNNMWNYVRSGAASEKYQNRWGIVADWLGIKPTQTRIYRAQQEQFARGYEAYLWRGELPNPIIKGAFDDYDKWLREVYNDINELNVELTDDAIRFFQSMTTGELPEPNVRAKTAETQETTPTQEETTQTAETEKAQETTTQSEGETQAENESVKQVKRDVETITRPNNPERVETNIKVGEKGKSAVYTRVMQRGEVALQNEYPELEYNKVNLKQQLERATDYVTSHLLDAREVVYGRKNPPKDILDTAIRIAYEEAMLAQGNIPEYLNALKTHSAVQTIRGQEISAERIGRDDISSPKYWFDKISYNRKTEVARKVLGRIDSIKENITGGSPVAVLNKLIQNKAKELQKLVLEAKTPEAQQKIMKKFAEQVKKQYGLNEIDDDTLYQKELITEKNASAELLAFMEDVFGTSVSQNEMAEVVAGLDNVTKSENMTEDATGNPSIQTLAMYDAQNKKVAALTPSSDLAIATSIVGRSMMLASIKSPVLNILSNAEMLVTEGLTNRLALLAQGKSVNNLVDSEVRNDYLRYGVQAYVASGYNISTTENMNFENLIRGERILTTQGEGKFKKFAQFMETGIFKYAMGMPDSVSKDLAFVDYVCLEASNAGKTKEKATEIFKDATLIEPKTKIGKEIRKRAMAYAHKATFTNDSIVSKFSLKLRDTVNTLTGDVRLGDQLMPFVKTPANVVAIGAEYSAGALYGLLHWKTILSDVKSGNLSDTSRNAIQYAVRNGLGAMLAAMLAYAFEPDDYVPEYEALTPSERNMYQAKNAVYNSVKIGNKYVSLDYFGPLGVPLAGMLSARREQAKGENAIKGYVAGAGYQAFTKTPGVKETKELYENTSRYLGQSADKTLADLWDASAQYVMSRTIPSIVNDMAKVLDDVERDTNRQIANVAKQKIPGLRNTLPERYNTLTGKPIPTESAASTLLFGSRVKTAADNAVIEEVSRLFGEGVRPALTDVTRYGKLKELDDDVKPEIRQKFAKLYSKAVADLIKTRSYQNADDDKKKRMIDKERRKATETIKQEYGIKRGR